MVTSTDSLDTLKLGKLTIRGEFLWGSNYTFLAEVAYNEQKLACVYKPRKGERPLWDFPVATLAKREVAAYLVSEALGWKLVPPTVYCDDGPLGPGSVQLYIEHDPEYHYFKFSEDDRQRLRPTTLFDLLINNADRKGGHILKSADGHLWLIDHGICFHVEDKLRTVVWDFAGELIPAALLSDVCRLVEQEEKHQLLTQKLDQLLRKGEIAALITRAQRLADQGIFPTPLGTRRSYPWPPV